MEDLHELLPQDDPTKPEFWTEERKLKYRFGGERYSMQGTEHYGPDDIIPQIVGLYPFPRDE